jgi:cytochrome c
MKRALITTAAGIAIALFQTVGHAEVDAKWAQAEAKEHGCLACHAVDKKKVGPSYASVSEKYKGKNAGDVIGSMKTFPVHQGVLKKTSDQDLKLIIDWVLSL